VKLLADLGHRRIAIAHWHRTDLNPWRLTGYRQGLRDAKLPRRRTWELATELTDAGAEEVIVQLLKLSPRPTAILGFNNTIARSMMEALARHNLRVPEDISVMGLGGEEVPGLTCYQADWYGLGQRGMLVLLRTLNASEPLEPEHHLFPHQLRKGQTTGAPAGE
jgi:LacI family transcriptional regulator